MMTMTMNEVPIYDYFKMSIFYPSPTTTSTMLYKTTILYIPLNNVPIQCLQKMKVYWFGLVSMQFYFDLRYNGVDEGGGSVCRGTIIITTNSPSVVAYRWRRIEYKGGVLLILLVSNKVMRKQPHHQQYFLLMKI